MLWFFYLFFYFLSTCYYYKVPPFGGAGFLFFSWFVLLLCVFMELVLGKLRVGIRMMFDCSSCQVDLNVGVLCHMFPCC